MDIKTYFKFIFLGLLNLSLGFALYSFIILQKDIIGILGVLGTFLCINLMIPIT